MQNSWAYFKCYLLDLSMCQIDQFYQPMFINMASVTIARYFLSFMIKYRSYRSTGIGKILITGGGGFIGSNLAEKLLKLGFEVICLDNFSSSNRKTIEGLSENKRLTIIEHNINIPIMIDDVSLIFSLACPASPKKYQEDPLFTLDTNFLGTKNVLNIAKNNGAKIIHASTSEIYGDPTEHPQKETYLGNVNTVGPRACYDEGKRVAETLISTFCGINNIDFTIMRIFNTYGPNMEIDDGRVISTFITQALRDEDITIFGDGKQTRSFQYIDDLLDAMIYLMNAKIIGPVNIGNPEEWTMTDLAMLVLRKVENSRSNIVFEPLPIDDPCRRKPDITKMKELTGWEPKVSLSLGLDRTISYFKEALEKEVVDVVA